MATTVHAATQAPATFLMAPNVIKGCTSGTCDGTSIDLTVTDPSTNPYAITAFTVTAPSGWSFSGDSAVTTNDYFTCTISSSSIACTWADQELPPGASTTLLGSSQEVALAPAASSSFPLKGTFTTSIQDASSVAYYPGLSFPVWSLDPTTSVGVALNPTTTTFTAGGSPYGVTATVGGSTSAAEAGVPVAWTIMGPGAGSVSPASDSTTTAGTATATFTPTNDATSGVNTNFVFATLGNTPTEDIFVFTGPSDTVTTVPSSPSQVTVSLGVASTTASYPNHYTTTYNLDASENGGAEVLGSAISVSLADSFGNAVAFIAGDSLSITANNGRFNSGGTTAVTLTCTYESECLSGSGYTVPNAYFQSTIYGSIGTISAQLTRGTTTFSTATFPEIITSTFATASPTPTANPNGDVGAGGTTTVAITPITDVQQGVPVNVTLDTSTSQESAGVAYNGAFSSGHEWIMATTTAAGTVSQTFTIDTTDGAFAHFQTIVSQPTDATPTGVLAASGDSAEVVTVAGSAAGLLVEFFYNPKITQTATDTIFGSTVYVDVTLVDAYNNVAVNTGSNQIQINLTPSAGVLSATSVYIKSDQSDTNSSFGAIAYTVPGTAQTLTLSASGVVNGLAVHGSSPLGVVSPLPTISVLTPAPLAGVIYASSTNPVFTGQANVSIGYPSTTLIYQVSYKIGSSNWVTTGAGGANTVLWSTAPTLAVGLNTIQFNTTDNTQTPPTLGNLAATPSYSVLVDPTAPTASFVTADGTTIANGAAVSASVTVAEGDLNFTSVTATANGTALAAADIAITGANNLGSSVTYTVAVSGLSTGTWVLGLSASSLAGLTGNAAQITVHVTVPLNQIFVSPSGFTQQTQSGASGVGGSITNQGGDPTATVWYQLLNSRNQVVQGPTFVQTFFSAGQSESFFFALQPGLASGTYTAQVFVTVAGTAESAVFTVTVTV